MWWSYTDKENKITFIFSFDFKSDFCYIVEMSDKTQQFNNRKQQAQELLKLHYGFDRFRPGQERAIEAILQGKNTVVIMPTGGGKSLIYQLPALVLEGVTIVVSPLISLMKDQVDSLQAVGIPATFINSTINQSESLKRLDDIKQGYVKILYIAPERFYDQAFLKALTEIKVSLFAIDEAHCISQWGHDFRPSYTRLQRAIEILDHPIVATLTATATPEVKADIIKQLGLVNPEIIVTGFARPNLQFGVAKAGENEKIQYVIDAALNLSDGVGIVYVSTRARAETVVQSLLENDIDAASYHAGMEAGDRKAVQDSFMTGATKVIVATNAFGLGIDKPDTRFVIHYDMPGTVEAYYQEAGRAGRDGQPSFCLLLYNSRDRHLHEFFIKGDNPPVNVVVEIYNILLNYETETVLITYSELGKMLSESLPEMAIGTSIKILEKEGLIMKSKEKQSNAYFKLLIDNEEALRRLGVRAKKPIEMFQKLRAKYQDDLKEGIEISVVVLAEFLEIKKEALSRFVKKMTELGIMEYTPPFRGTEIKILKRVDPYEIDIDTTAMKEKLDRAYEKLDKMESYIYSYQCRQKYILNYFGDKEANDCEKCDVCLADVKRSKKREVPKREWLGSF